MMPTMLTAARTTPERLRPFTRLQSGATTLGAAERPASGCDVAFTTVRSAIDRGEGSRAARREPIARSYHLSQHSSRRITALMAELQQATVRASWACLFEEPTLLRVGHRLKAGVCAELVVDVVEMVAERLGGNAQLAGDGRGIAAFGEELQDAELLLGERLDRCVMGRVAGKRNELSGDVDHAVEPLLVAPALIDVAFQPHEESASRALVVEDDCGDIHPDPAPRSGADLQVEIGDHAGRSVPATGRRFCAPGERAGAQRVACLEHLVDVA